MQFPLLSKFLLSALFSLFAMTGYGQGNASIFGKVLEAGSGQALAGVSVRVSNADTLFGALTDSSGRYRVANLPFGRYNLTFRLIGFVDQRVNEVLVASRSGQEINASLEEQAVETGTVQIYSLRKWDTRNEAALVSGRSFSGEELSRIAGGLDDPSRVAARLPGVVPSPDLITNNINVRGNPSRAVLWRLEGIDIYNPNHFGQLEGSNGIVTIFSQQLLAQTDFFTAAFPADYGNALGSIFDVRFRNGSRDRLHGAFQIGLLGLDASLEGPLGKQERTSFLFNYRYSTTGIADQFLQVGAIPVFQDLSFKIHHEFKSGGQVNFFGIGGISTLTTQPETDTTLWDSLVAANVGRDSRALTGTAGLSFSLPLGSKTYLQAVGVGTGINFDNYGYELDRSLVPDTMRKGETRTYRLSSHVFLNHKFGPAHTHRSGFMAHRLSANSFFSLPLDSATIPDTLYTGTGSSYLFQFYTRSQLKLGPRVQLNLGLHAMHFALNQEWSLEPRLGIRYQLSNRQSLSFGYGLHSQMEPFYTYVVTTRDEQGNQMRQNEDLGFNKAHHFVLSYQWRFREHFRFLAEAYYQPIYRLVTARNLPVTRLGGLDFTFESYDLTNTGSARTYGLDLSLEKSLHQGYYFMVNASLIDSEYQDLQGRSFPSTFNVGYMGSILAGKEWYLNPKKNKTRILGLNLALNLTGPQYYTRVDLPASLQRDLFTFDYANPNTERQDPLQLVDVGLTYRVSRRKVSTLLSFQIKNLLNQRVLLGQTYDSEKGITGEQFGTGLFPILSYQIRI